MPTLVGSDFFLSTKQHIFAIVIIITSINYLDYSFQFFAMTYKWMIVVSLCMFKRLLNPWLEGVFLV